MVYQKILLVPLSVPLLAPLLTDIAFLGPIRYSHRYDTGCIVLYRPSLVCLHGRGPVSGFLLKQCVSCNFSFCDSSDICHCWLLLSLSLLLFVTVLLSLLLLFAAVWVDFSEADSIQIDRQRTCLPPLSPIYQRPEQSARAFFSG